MLKQFQPALRFALGLLQLLALPVLAWATTWSPRKDIGIAAVDLRTGNVIWEAWQPADVPKDFSEKERVAFKDLLDPTDREFMPEWPSFPANLTKDLVVIYSHDTAQDHFILAHGQRDAVGGEIASFSFDVKKKWHYALSGQTLYLLLDGRILALTGNVPAESTGQPWQPAWTLNLQADLPEQEQKAAEHLPKSLRTNADGVWVIYGSRIHHFTPQGRKQAQYVITKDNPNMVDRDTAARLTFDKRLLYYRHSKGVIAFDRQTKKEAWRLATTLFPNTSRVVEIGDNRVLVQIGSQVPQTIRGALEGDKHVLPKLGANTVKQRVAAARLLHSYGDGYLRKTLSVQLCQFQKANDPEAKQAAATLEKLLNTWPQKHDTQRLIEACIHSLLQSKDRDPPQDFASPASQRLLTWCLMQELIYGRIPDGYYRPGSNYAYDSWEENRLWLVDDSREKLIALCWQVLTRGPEAEKPFAASVLVSRAIGWYSLTDAKRKELFLSTQPAVWRWTAMSLVKNGWRKELLQWAPQRPADDYLDILWILAHKMPEEWSDAELDFWLKSAQHAPGGVASLLHVQSDHDIPLAFRKPIRASLEKEIAMPTVKDLDHPEAGNLVAALLVLDQYADPNDGALLRQYCKHPCDRVREYAESIVKKRQEKTK